jgi:hypothetical protein
MFINYHAKSNDALLAVEMNQKEYDLIAKCYSEISKYIPKLFNCYIPMTTHTLANKSYLGFVIADLHYVQGKSNKPNYTAFLDTTGELMAIQDIKQIFIFKSKQYKETK